MFDVAEWSAPLGTDPFTCRREGRHSWRPAREDALCVMHTHTPNGVAVSAQKSGPLPISQQQA
ncbi:class II aldolase/adducin family protein [Bradyrhizobium sp. CCBAU 51753]|uniref:class II aldolase/adducin family protein n=1 Tax=Bradyrhizobium sp. CCBAU 51753 TaxID=1325100 RepID=UPI001AEE4C18